MSTNEKFSVFPPAAGLNSATDYVVGIQYSPITSSYFNVKVSIGTLIATLPAGPPGPPGPAGVGNLTTTGTVTAGAPLVFSGPLIGGQALTTSGATTGTGAIVLASGAAITGATVNNTAIGGTTAAAGSFTTLSSTGTATLAALNVAGSVAGAGFATYLASPPAIGGTAASAGAFTGVATGTLSASGAVSGTGFSTYLASPPAIGGTTPSAGSFTAGSFSTSLTAPTRTVGDSTTNAATTAFVAAALTALGSSASFNGRLTLTSLTPVLSSNVVAATSVIFTPYNGNQVAIWNGSVFVGMPFTEVSQVLSDTTKSPAAAVLANAYDMFAWMDSGTFRVTRGPPWASGTGGSNTVRGTGSGSTALTRVQGVLVNANAITNGPAAGFGTYVGTIMTDAAAATVTMSFGSAASGGGTAILGVWNNFNRVSIKPFVQDSTTSHTYATASWRAYNNSVNNSIKIVSGFSEDDIDLIIRGMVLAVTGTGGGNLGIGIGLNSTTAATASQALVGAASGSLVSLVATLSLRSPIGINVFQALDFGGGGGSGGTFYDTQNYSISASLRM